MALDGSSYAAVVAAGLQKSAENKERDFLFLFRGRGIDISVFEGSLKVKWVEVGELEAETKYCVISLHRMAGRRASNLVNVVHEYNGLAQPDFRVELQMDTIGGGKQVPALYLIRKGFAGNPATLKLMSDRLARPPTFSSWKNPLFPGDRRTTAYGGGRGRKGAARVAPPSSELSQEEEVGRDAIETEGEESD